MKENPVNNLSQEGKRITIPTVNITLHNLCISKKKLKQYGSLKIYKDLLYDIIERYANDEYFDPEYIRDMMIDEGIIENINGEYINVKTGEVSVYQ